MKEILRRIIIYTNFILLGLSTLALSCEDTENFGMWLVVWIITASFTYLLIKAYDYSHGGAK